MEIVLIAAYAILSIIGLVIFRVIIELYIQVKQEQARKKEKYVTISVRVSRENEAGPIVAEHIFATIHSIGKKLKFLDRLKGKHQDLVSFEIANVDRNIRFYAHFPARLRNLVEGQIYAQYPNVEIVEVPDYSAPIQVELISHREGIFEGREKGLELSDPTKQKITTTTGDLISIDIFRNAVGTTLKLLSPDYMPIKRYPQFDDKKAKVALDPLAAVTSTLSKFNDQEDQAWIQVVISPLEERWRKVYMRCLKIVTKKIFLNIDVLKKSYIRTYITRSRIIRAFFFPIYWYFTIKALGLGTSESKSEVADGELEDQYAKTHEKETGTVAAVDKVGKLMFETMIRIVYIPKNAGRDVALVKLREIAGSFKQFNIPHLNGFAINEITHGTDVVNDYHQRTMKNSFVMNTEELATIFHLPNTTVTTPNIYWVRSKRLEPPIDLPTRRDSQDENLTILGKTNFRASNQVFGIKTLDRRRHIYVIGKTGMGKSTLLENMIFSDIHAGRGLAVVDPHGDLADAVLNFIPARRTNDVIVFDPSDRDYPVALNMLENIDPAFSSIVSSGLVGIFKKIYGESWGPRLEHILRNTILALLEYPNTTMLGIPRILQDKDFRGRVVRKITDPIVKSFWINEFEKMDPKQRVEAISPILNKVGQFLSSPIIRNILGQPRSAVDIRFAMDNKKIVIVNLSKGKIGEDISSLLGSMIITKFQLDAMSRANIPEKDRTDFYLYVDEFQNFATDSFATILSEARKYKLNLTMANQYIAQMPEEVRDAVFGNVGTIISFQVGFDDAEYLSGQYGEEVLPNDLVSLSKHTAYSRLLVDGMPTKTFSLDTLPPPDFVQEPGRRDKVIKMSRERFSTPRTVVEDKIRRWSESATLEEKNKDTVKTFAPVSAIQTTKK